MALFSRTNKKETPKETLPPRPVAEASEPRRLVILSPRVTEKATADSGRRVYTFNVLPRANKSEVKSAVETLFKVSVTNVSLARIPRKNLFQRGKKGTTARGKKAYVTVAAGQQIEFV